MDGSIAGLGRDLAWPTDEETEESRRLVASFGQAVEIAEKNKLPLQTSLPCLMQAMAAHITMGMAIGRAKAAMERFMAPVAN